MDSPDPPSIKEHAGRWDEFVNRVILVAPWLAIVAYAIYILTTGRVRTDITISGTVPVDILAYLVVGLFAVTYALALMKFYGAKPLSWLLTRVHNLAKNYNPPQ